MKNIQLNIDRPERIVGVTYDAGRKILRVTIGGKTVLRVRGIPAPVQFTVYGRDSTDTTELDVHAKALSSYGAELVTPPRPRNAHKEFGALLRRLRSAGDQHADETPATPEPQALDCGRPSNLDPINWDDDETHLPPFEQTASTNETSPSTVELPWDLDESAEYVFRDPAEKQVEAWRIFWHGDICTPCFNSKGAAEACLHMYQRGERKPEL